MTRAAVVAFGAVSALGEGRSAIESGEQGREARSNLAPSRALASAGLRRVLVGEAPPAALGSAAGGARLEHAPE